MLNNKVITICCPKCGYEYLPGEIYLPNEFIGRPTNVTRNSLGKIIYYGGDTLNTREEFECENCGCVFNVDARIMFVSRESGEHNFDEDYEIDINSEENESLW